MVTTLRRCGRCELLFVAPTVSPKESADFYQTKYGQGFTTELPSDEILSTLLAIEFKGSNKDYSTYLTILRALGIDPKKRILDFGCSWGYGTWQLQNAGYQVQAYEISRPRCAFARSKLGIDAVNTMEELKPPFDCFFSAHVLEHVPSVSEVLNFAWNSLRPGGAFVAFTPNGSAVNRRQDPEHWHRRWGFVHPQLLDDRFCRRYAADGPCLLASRPFDIDAIAAWDQKSFVQCSLAGDELLIVFQKPG